MLDGDQHKENDGADSGKTGSVLECKHNGVVMHLALEGLHPHPADPEQQCGKHAPQGRPVTVEKIAVRGIQVNGHDDDGQIAG